MTELRQQGLCLQRPAVQFTYYEKAGDDLSPDEKAKATSTQQTVKRLICKINTR